MTVRTVITDLVELYLQDMNVNDSAFSFNLQGQDVYAGEIMYMYTYLSQADKSIKGDHQGYNIIIFLGQVMIMIIAEQSSSVGLLVDMCSIYKNNHPRDGHQSKY